MLKPWAALSAERKTARAAAYARRFVAATSHYQAHPNPVPVLGAFLYLPLPTPGDSMQMAVADVPPDVLERLCAGQPLEQWGVDALVTSYMRAFDD